jgi:hypothetical protein
MLGGLKLVRGRLDHASMGNALDDPEPLAARQASAASKHAEPRSKQVFVCCGNPDRHHKAEIDASGFPAT